MRTMKTEIPGQQAFLRQAAKDLKLSQKNLAIRMGVPWDTFRRWLLPSGSDGARGMPEMAWKFIDEIKAHERLMKSIKPS